MVVKYGRHTKRLSFNDGFSGAGGMGRQTAPILAFARSVRAILLPLGQWPRVD